MIEEKRLQKELEQTIAWVKEQVDHCHGKGVVIGNSGGKDSAVVIAMAVEALGASQVTTIAMPCQSSSNDLQDAKLVAGTFGVPCLEIDLTKTYETLEETIMKHIEKEKKIGISEEAKINSKPRLRMTTLYAVAQTLDYLVLGTGNLCERMVGYTTKWGDSGCDLNPIGLYTVEEVLCMGKWLGVPEKILQKAPSDGLGGSTDEEKMGITYFQIAEYIEKGHTDQKAMEVIDQKYHATKHKREQIPMYPLHRTNYLEEMNS